MQIDLNYTVQYMLNYTVQYMLNYTVQYMLFEHVSCEKSSVQAIVYIVIDMFLSVDLLID